MNKVIRTFVLGAVALSMSACATQKDQAGNNQRQGGRPDFSQILSEMDANNDGKLSKSEVKGPLLNDFSKIDTNGDGFISKEELSNAPKPQQGRPPRG